MRISRETSTVQIMIDQKQLEIVEYFNYLGSIITNATRCFMKLNPGLPCKEQHSKERRLFSSQTGFKFMEETSKCYIWSTALYGAKTWTLWKVDKKLLESF